MWILLLLTSNALGNDYAEWCDQNYKLVDKVAEQVETVAQARTDELENLLAYTKIYARTSKLCNSAESHNKVYYCGRAKELEASIEESASKVEQHQSKLDELHSGLLQMHFELEERCSQYEVD